MTQITHPLVTPQALHALLQDPSTAPTVLDVRWQLGRPSLRPAYEEGHLPDAAWVEFEKALTGWPGEGGRHPLPAKAVFAAAMQAAGVRNDRPVVVYDEANSLGASRLWWLLRYFGKDDVQVLDGGFAAWLRAGLPLESEGTSPRPGDFTAAARPEMLLDADGAARYADTELLLDARPAERYAGRNEIIDPVAGHIPGAKPSPALVNVQEDGRFLPADELAARFGEQGITTGTVVGTYCGSGVQAAHLALAFEVAGLHPQTAVYVGSWSQWITDADRPVVTE
ncbi:sulfurtransferase [Leekyejoonella antrihumi]|uniref:Sulfurtransferase n=1 Tax=Leekyejoonella antrihumi TaxID=1660198 RepID=A0A563DUX0_9MICO|nr:sulfurtransferase [Leekyejoonella antrihumi]TWP34050.1 sulfurtransferase [Leekyejoonella antrihumi]